MNTESGFINSIKTIYTEIEGVLQLKLSPGIKKSFKDLISLLKTTCPEGSLYFPEYFGQYLSQFLYRNFNLDTGIVELSRHSIGHGIAKTEDYDKISALQGILILDHIYYYFSVPT